MFSETILKKSRFGGLTAEWRVALLAFLRILKPCKHERKRKSTTLEADLERAFEQTNLECAS